MKPTLLCVALFLPAAAEALPNAAARDELASELAVCASYYSVGAVLSENSGHADEATKLRPTIETALDLSSKLSSQKKAQARYELAMQSHLKTFKEEGFARLILQHSEPCKVALEHPDERLQYWLNRK